MRAILVRGSLRKPSVFEAAASSRLISMANH
jgi:hypothetical protein